MRGARESMAPRNIRRYNVTHSRMQIFLIYLTSPDRSRPARQIYRMNLITMKKSSSSAVSTYCTLCNQNSTCFVNESKQQSINSSHNRVWGKTFLKKCCKSHPRACLSEKHRSNLHKRCLVKTECLEKCTFHMLIICSRYMPQRQLYCTHSQFRVPALWLIIKHGSYEPFPETIACAAFTLAIAPTATASVAHHPFSLFCPVPMVLPAQANGISGFIYVGPMASIQFCYSIQQQGCYALIQIVMLLYSQLSAVAAHKNWLCWYDSVWGANNSVHYACADRFQMCIEALQMQFNSSLQIVRLPIS